MDEPAVGETVAPKAPILVLEESLADLESAVAFAVGRVASSHTVVIVDGLDKPKAPVALGRYLVGALAGAVDIDARLCSDFLAHGADRQAEITQTVINIIGETNEFTTTSDQQFRDTRRNAWIGEGVGHALLMLTARRETPSVNGQVRTLTEVHPNPTRQGLDSVSTYVQGGVLAVAIGESKTTCSNGSNQLGHAASLFAQVDKGVHGPELRARLLAFRGFLPHELAVQVSESLWSDNGCYLPMIVHQDEFDPTTRRPTLARLAPPVERRRVIIVRLRAFHAFFDAVADAMRTAVPELVF